MPTKSHHLTTLKDHFGDSFNNLVAKPELIPSPTKPSIKKHGVFPYGVGFRDGRRIKGVAWKDAPMLRLPVHVTVEGSKHESFVSYGKDWPKVRIKSVELQENQRARVLVEMPDGSKAARSVLPIILSPARRAKEEYDLAD